MRQDCTGLPSFFPGQTTSSPPREALLLGSTRDSRARVGVPPTRFFGETPKTTPETGMLPGKLWFERPF